MKMKRYFAADARTALRELREEQGDEAIILSNRKVSGGVEIIAAMDYEESLLNTSLGNPSTLAETAGPAMGNQPAGTNSEAHSAANEEVEEAAPGSRSSTHDDSVQRQNSAAYLRDVSALAEQSRAEQSLAEQSDDYPVDNSAVVNFSGNHDTAAGQFNETGMAHGQQHAATAKDLEKIQDELKGLRNIMEAPLMQLSWGELERVQPLYAGLLKQLMNLGLSAQLCEKIASTMVDRGLHKHSWLESLKLLAEMLPVADEDLMRDGGVISLIGPTGVGKTTTIAKLAARFALRHGRRNIALVTTDSYRIGAHEQLRTYGRILGVPVQVAADNDELQAVLNSCRDKKLILIDTSGVSQRDQRLAEQLATLEVSAMPIKNYLVLSATGQMRLQEDVIESFSKADLHGCILTKIDEAASLGEMLSVLTEHELPVAYVSDGQKVPDDLHPARGQLLVKEAVKLMQKANRKPSEKELAFMFGGMINNANI